MKKKQTSQGVMLVSTFSVLMATNIAVVYVANVLAPSNVVLGTYYIDKLWALLHSMGTLALVNTFAVPFIREYEDARGEMITTSEWMKYYLVLNLVGLWVISRFSAHLGLGLSSLWVVFFLAIALDFFQGIAMMWLEKNK